MKRTITLGLGATACLATLLWAAPMPDHPLLSGLATVSDFIQIWDDSSEKGAAKISFSGVETTFLNGVGAFSSDTEPLFTGWDKDFDDLINTPPEMSDAEVVAGTSTTPMLVSAAQLKLAITTHADSFDLPTGEIGDFLQYDDTDSVIAYTPTTAAAGEGIDITDGVISVEIDASGFSGNLATTDDTLEESLGKFDAYNASFAAPSLSTVEVNGSTYTFTYSQAVEADTDAELCTDYDLTWTTGGAITFAYVSATDTVVVCDSTTAITSTDTISDGLDYDSSAGNIVNSSDIPLASITSKTVTNNTPASGSEPSDDFSTDTIATNYTQVGPDTTESAAAGRWGATTNYDHVMYAYDDAVSSNNMTINSTGKFGEGRLQIGFRLSLTGNTASGYILAFSDSDVKLYDCTTAVELNISNCSSTTVGHYSSTWDQNVDHDFIVTASGSTLNVWVDTVQVLTDKTLPTTHSGTQVALGWYSGSDYVEHSFDSWSTETP